MLILLALLVTTSAAAASMWMLIDAVKAHASEVKTGDAQLRNEVLALIEKKMGELNTNQMATTTKLNELIYVSVLPQDKRDKLNLSEPESLRRRRGVSD